MTIQLTKDIYTPKKYLLKAGSFHAVVKFGVGPLVPNCVRWIIKSGNNETVEVHSLEAIVSDVGNFNDLEIDNPGDLGGVSI